MKIRAKRDWGAIKKGTILPIKRFTKFDMADFDEEHIPNFTACPIFGLDDWKKGGNSRWERVD